MPTKMLQPTTTNSLAVFATQLRQDPNELSLLLDLPADIRNIIYAMVLGNTEARLSRNSAKNNLATTSALPRVNKQVRAEFMAMVWLSADIQTTVLDFDFRHIVTFLNRLSDAELQALPSISVPASRKVKVELSVRLVCPLQPPLLPRWIKRADHPTKKGTGIDFKYTLDAKTKEKMLATFRQPWRRDYWRLPAEWSVWHDSMPAGRTKEEFGKILKAVLNA